MQELWLFGQLKTLEQSDDTKTRIDKDAEEVGQLLVQLMALKSANGETDANGRSGSHTPEMAGADVSVQHGA